MSSNFNPPNRPHDGRPPPPRHNPQPPRPVPLPPPRPTLTRPHPPMPSPPSGPRPQRPNWPQGRPPQRPTMPTAPRPPHHTSLPFGFAVLPQAQVGIIFSSRGSVQMWSIRFSQPINRVPSNSFVWIFGERGGWTLIHFEGQFGFVDSRFVFLL